MFYLELCYWKIDKKILLTMKIFENLVNLGYLKTWLFENLGYLKTIWKFDT